MTQQHGRSQSAHVWVEATPREQRVRPGEQAVFAVTVENRSDAAQNQELGVEGLPAGWANLAGATRGVAFPQERRNATVTVTVPEDAEGGRMAFAIVARAGAEESSAEVTLDVQAVEERPLAPGLALQPSVLELEAGAGEQRIQVDVRNVGTRDSEYRLEVLGLPGGWQRGGGLVAVAAGATAEAELWVQAPRGAMEGSQPFTVRLAAEGYPEIFAEAGGELRVRAAPQPVETPPPPRPVEPQRQAPPPMPEGPRLEVEDDSPVRPPDVLLAPSTTFRFGAGNVSEQAIVTIQNRSRVRERYEIAVDGLPDGWYTLTATDVSLEPGASQQVPLRLSPRPGPDAPAGEYRFSVRVAPHGYPQASNEIAALLTIEGVVAFDVRLEPPQATGRTVTYQMTLRNTGTRPVELDCEGVDPEGRCKFRIPRAPQIDAGREAVLPVRVGARRNRFVGSPETFDFRIRAWPRETDPTAARSFDARFVHRPIFSRRVPVLLGFYAVLIAIMAFLVFWSPAKVESMVQWGGCQVHRGPECDEDTSAQVEETPTATATATATTPPTSSPTTEATALPLVACTNDEGQTSQVEGLQVGGVAYLDDRSNIRSGPLVAPNNANRIGQVALDSVPEAQQEEARKVAIVGGPFCGPDFTWWEVRSDFYGIDNGWVVELDGTGDVNLSPEP